MIETDYRHRTRAEGLLAGEVAGGWEAWMKEADELLEDEELVDLVYEALGRHHPRSRTRKRKGTPARGGATSAGEHGLNRCRYRGFDGMQRWVGLGVIADNLITLGHLLAKKQRR